MHIQRTLVIDDEQIVLDSVRKILETDSCVVDVCLSGRIGLLRALDYDYDIVLSDIRMPDIGGMHVLREIKRHKPGLPVVMITGFATVQSAVQAMKLGADDYLEKPFTPEMLLQAVDNALRHAATNPPEQQAIVHKEELTRVLDRTATDSSFVGELFNRGADALDDYELTRAEKLALLTGDIAWIEKHIGALTAEQRRWLELRLCAEIW